MSVNARACLQCKQKHRACHGGRPCDRCRINDIPCTEAPETQTRGRRKREERDSEEFVINVDTSVRHDSDEQQQQQQQQQVNKDSCGQPLSKYNTRRKAVEGLLDVRLLSAYQLLLAEPELSFFKHPVLAASVFGVHLGPRFYVCELAPFLPSHTLDSHQAETRIRFVSPPLLVLLESSPEELVRETSIGWENIPCNVHVVREALTSLMPLQQVRRWEHERVLKLRSGKRYNCLLKGYVWSTRTIMVVDVESADLLVPEPQVAPATKSDLHHPFTFSDLGLFDFDPLINERSTSDELMRGLEGGTALSSNNNE